MMIMLELEKSVCSETNCWPDNCQNRLNQTHHSTSVKLPERIDRERAEPFQLGQISHHHKRSVLKSSETQMEDIDFMMLAALDTKKTVLFDVVENILQKFEI